MKRTDILTTAILGLGLLGLAALGFAANKFDAVKFRARMKEYADKFPDSIRMLREDLIAEEMMPEVEEPSYE